MPDHASPSRAVPGRLRDDSATLSVSTSPQMKLTFDDPSNGTELTRSVSGSNPPSTVEVRFDPPGPNDQLSGQPAAWCNSPGGGQPLIFNVPVPNKPGDPDTYGDLVVDNTSNAAPAVRIPITVKHYN